MSSKMNPPFLSICNIGKTYYKNKTPLKEALKGATFDIHRGEVVGLLGVNGAGKTTLSSIIATLHPPTTGDILWEGRSVYSCLFNYRRQIGFCPQHPNIDRTLTMQANLLFAGRYYGLSKEKAEERKEQLIERFDLKSSAASEAQHLSGGQRQRFLIARSLMHEPALLILDEPTVGLDPHIRRETWNILSELKKIRISVLLTTHYLDEAELLSDRICLIHEGTIRTIDTPDNLKTRHRKSNLEEVFLKFVDDPEAEIFNSGTSTSPFEE